MATITMKHQKKFSFYYGNIDELDEVLLDQFSTDYIIAEFGGNVTQEAEVFHNNLAMLAYRVRQEAQVDRYQVGRRMELVSEDAVAADRSVLVMDKTKKTITLTGVGESFIEKLYLGLDWKVERKKLTQKEFRKHVIKALIVEYTYEKGKDYEVVKKEWEVEGEEWAVRAEISLMEESGLLTDRRLSDLGRYLDAKHSITTGTNKVRIKEDNKTSSKLSGINVIESFEGWSGFTGTFPKEQVAEEAGKVLGKKKEDILQMPRFAERIVVEGKPIYAMTLDDLCEKLAEEVKRLRADNESSPISIILSNGIQTRRVFETMRDLGIVDEYLHLIRVNEDVDLAEAYGGRNGHVTIGTPIIGRGINMNPLRFSEGINKYRKVIENGIDVGKIADETLFSGICSGFEAQGLTETGARNKLNEMLRKMVKEKKSVDEILKEDEYKRFGTVINTSDFRRKMEKMEQIMSQAMSQAMAQTEKIRGICNDLKEKFRERSSQGGDSEKRKEKQEELRKAQRELAKMIGIDLDEAKERTRKAEESLAEAQKNLRNTIEAEEREDGTIEGARELVSEITTGVLKVAIEKTEKGQEYDIGKITEELLTKRIELNTKLKKYSDRLQNTIKAAVENKTEFELLSGSSIAGEYGLAAFRAGQRYVEVRDKDDIAGLKQAKKAKDDAEERLDRLDNIITAEQMFLNAFQVVTAASINGLQLYSLKMGTKRLCDQVLGRSAREWDAGRITECIIMEASDQNRPEDWDGEGSFSFIMERGIGDLNRDGYIPWGEKRRRWFFNRMSSYGEMRDVLFEGVRDLRTEWVKLTQELKRLELKTQSEKIQDDLAEEQRQKVRKRVIEVEGRLDLFFELALRNIDKMAADNRIMRTPFSQADYEEMLRLEKEEEKEFEAIHDKTVQDIRKNKSGEDEASYGAKEMVEDIFDIIFEDVIEEVKKEKKAKKGDMAEERKKNGKLLRENLLFLGIKESQIKWALEEILPVRENGSVKTLEEAIEGLSSKELIRFFKKLRKTLKTGFAGHIHISMKCLEWSRKAIKSDLFEKWQETQGRIFSKAQKGRVKEKVKSYKSEIRKATKKFLKEYSKNFARAFFEKQLMERDRNKKGTDKKMEGEVIGKMVSEAYAEAKQKPPSDFERVMRWIGVTRVGRGVAGAYRRFAKGEGKIGWIRKGIDQGSRPQVNDPINIKGGSPRQTMQLKKSTEVSDWVNAARMDPAAPGTEVEKELEEEKLSIEESVKKEEERRKAEKIEEKAKKEKLRDAAESDVDAVRAMAVRPVPSDGKSPMLESGINVFGGMPDDDDEKEKLLASVNELIGDEKNINQEDKKNVSVIVDEYEMQGDKRIVIKARTFTWHGDVLVLKYYGQKGKTDPINEGDCRRAAFSLPEGKLKEGCAILVIGGDVSASNTKDLVEKVIKMRQSGKNFVLGVNDVNYPGGEEEGVDKLEIKGIGVVGDARSFEADKAIADSEKRVNPGLKDAELSGRLSRVSPETRIAAFNVTYIDGDGNTATRKRIANNRDGVVLVEDAGEGKFSRDFMTTVHRLGTGRGISTDLVLGEIHTLDDVPRDQIEIAVKAGMAVLKIGNQDKYSEKYVDDAYLTKRLPAVAMPEANRILMLFIIYLSGYFNGWTRGIIRHGGKPLCL